MTVLQKSTKKTATEDSKQDRNSIKEIGNSICMNFIRRLSEGIFRWWTGKNNIFLCVLFFLSFLVI
jgi:hypothetical protein